MEGLTVLMFFLASIYTVSSDHYYEACKPIECGGINITYPFYVLGQQRSYCGFPGFPGFPGFQVFCKNNLPFVNLSGDTYIISQISYINQSLWIINSVFSPSIFECISITSVHNLTLNNAKLDFISKPEKIVLLQDCSKEALQSMSNYTMINCKNNSYRHSSNSLVGMHEQDFKWKEVAGKCKRAISVPYDGSGGSKMEDAIRKGFALKWIATDCRSCQESGGRCVSNQSTLEPQCFCSDGLPHDYCPGEDNTVRLLFASVAMMVVLTIGGPPSVICCTRMIISTIKHTKSWWRTAEDNRNVEAFIKSQGSLAPKRFTYSDIKKMTSSFKEKLGEGGYSVVYKGKLLDGHLVAVKLLKQSKDDGKEFINEVASISRTNHVNVVTLLGFCFEGRKRGLVFEFMANGSLEKFTRVGTDNSQTLAWETLFQIALGIARGLEYLHRGCNTRILHFDIKPHNILLDENFCPKISDFGLARLCPETEQSKISMSAARGTIGYIAPEVFCRNVGDVSHKSDVYSYGMMVLEVIGSRKNTNAQVETSSSALYFPHWIYKQLEHGEELDDRIMNDEEKGLKRKMILVSLWCIQTIPSSRPSMSRVVQMLEGSLESIEIPPIRSLSLPPRSQADPSESSTMT